MFRLASFDALTAPAGPNHALKHGTKLATFDSTIPVEVLAGGSQAIEQIPV